MLRPEQVDWLGYCPLYGSDVRGRERRSHKTNGFALVWLDLPAAALAALLQLR